MIIINCWPNDYYSLSSARLNRKNYHQASCRIRTCLNYLIVDESREWSVLVRVQTRVLFETIINYHDHLNGAYRSRWKNALTHCKKKQWSRFSISKILSYWCCSYRLKKSFRYIAEIGLWQISGFSFSAAKNIINRASECVSFGFSFHILVLFPSIEV